MPGDGNNDGVRPRAGGITRRELCFGIGGIAGLLCIGGVKVVGADAAVRPPGGQDEAALLSTCVRCQKCYEACPRHVIAPAHIENGIVGVRTPVLSFDAGYCDFCEEENGGVPLCARACPTRALDPAVADGGDLARSFVLGKANIERSTCLGWQLMGCRFCYDACPYDAMELDADGRPHVISERCNGCGACESVCVSLKEGSIASGATRRAIVVEPA